MKTNIRIGNVVDLDYKLSQIEKYKVPQKLDNQSISEVIRQLIQFDAGLSLSMRAHKDAYPPLFKKFKHTELFTREETKDKEGETTTFSFKNTVISFTQLYRYGEFHQYEGITEAKYTKNNILLVDQMYYGYEGPTQHVVPEVIQLLKNLFVLMRKEIESFHTFVKKLPDIKIPHIE